MLGALAADLVSFRIGRAVLCRSYMVRISGFLPFLTLLLYQLGLVHRAMWTGLYLGPEVPGKDATG
jgi:hypothetical protein